MLVKTGSDLDGLKMLEQADLDDPTTDEDVEKDKYGKIKVKDMD